MLGHRVHFDEKRYLACSPSDSCRPDLLEGYFLPAAQSLGDLASSRPDDQALLLPGDLVYVHPGDLVYALPADQACAHPGVLVWLPRSYRTGFWGVAFGPQPLVWHVD